jgi:Spy/CpxP family protein refolding chaperone
MPSDDREKKAILLVVVVFLLGIALGGLSDHLWGNHVWAARSATVRLTSTQRVQEMTNQLSLTPDQQKQILAIIDETRAKWQSVNDATARELAQTREEARNRIRAILTPEQLPKYEEFNRKLDEERKRREQERR